MLRIIMICLLTSVSISASAFEYDVEWPESNGAQQTSTLMITIDGCKTRIYMKNTDIEAFKRDSGALQRAVKLSIERSKSGCAKQ